ATTMSGHRMNVCTGVRPSQWRSQRRICCVVSLMSVLGARPRGGPMRPEGHPPIGTRSDVAAYGDEIALSCTSSQWSNPMRSLCVQVLALLCAVAGFAAASSPGCAQEPFYKGKRLTALVNYAPGGSTDAEARVFARHIGRHIEGNPAIVVQNM